MPWKLFTSFGFLNVLIECSLHQLDCIHRKCFTILRGRFSCYTNLHYANAVIDDNQGSAASHSGKRFPYPEKGTKATCWTDLNTINQFAASGKTLTINVRGKYEAHGELRAESITPSLSWKKKLSESVKHLRKS